MTDRANRPNPQEGRAEIKSTVQILGLDEYVRVDEINGHLVTPILRPRSLIVEVFVIPNILNASR